MLIGDAQKIAASLKLTILDIDPDKIVMSKVTGGKVTAYFKQNSVVAGGVSFEGETLADSLFWALQWYVYCR